MRLHRGVAVTPALAAFIFVPRLAAGQAVLLSEDFNSVADLPVQGWEFINRSTLPVQDWTQGDDLAFAAHEGFAAEYAGSSFNATAGIAPDETISNWLLTPTLTLSDGASVSFWSRTVDFPEFPDRFEVRLSTAGASVNVGTAPGDSGDFSLKLLEINPAQTVTDYPGDWTQYVAMVSGVGENVSGRIGFRHYVENAGASALNGDYIGLDTVRVLAPSAVVPEPATLAPVAAGLVGVRIRRRRSRPSLGSL